MKQLNILIADDEASIRNGLSRAINWNEMDMRVVGTVANGIEALVLLATCSVDIIITDIRMPECDGLELIRQAKEIKPDCRFIIVSGYDDFKYAQTAIRYGVCSYLIKPIKKAELMDELQTLAKETNHHVDDHLLTVGADAMRHRFFQGLLKNEYRRSEEIRRILTELEIDLQMENSRIVVFLFVLPSEDEGGQFTQGDSIIFKVALKNMLNELMNEYHHFAFEYENDKVVLIINEQPGQFINYREICTKSIQTVTQYINVQIYAGIGTHLDHLLFAFDSYKNAVEALAYSIYDNGSCVFDSTLLEAMPPPATGVEKLDIDAFIHTILIGDLDRLKMLTDDFFLSLLYVEAPPPSFVRGTCTYLLIAVEKGLNEHLEPMCRLSGKDEQVILSGCRCFEAIRQFVLERFLDDTAHMSLYSSLKKDPVIEQAKKYIEQNITKKLLLDEVASYVHLSESYFATLFKEKTGKNYRTYVMEAKVSKAKELLVTSRYSVSEIANMLGYEDYRSFNRLFKNITGQTPSSIYLSCRRGKSNV